LSVGTPGSSHELEGRDQQGYESNVDGPLLVLRAFGRLVLEEPDVEIDGSKASAKSVLLPSHVPLLILLFPVDRRDISAFYDQPPEAVTKLGEAPWLLSRVAFFDAPIPPVPPSRPRGPLHKPHHQVDDFGPHLHPNRTRIVRQPDKGRLLAGSGAHFRSLAVLAFRS